MSIEDDISKGLIESPPPKMITDKDGTIIRMAELSDVLTPQYRRCKTCSARNRCSRVQKKGKSFLDVDCVIEKEQLEVLLTRLTLEGVTLQDELLVYPLVRNMFLMTRTYELETIIDLNYLLRNKFEMQKFKDLMGISNKAETQYIKILKELIATRKEDQKKTIHTIKTTFDLSKKLSEKNANKN